MHICSHSDIISHPPWFKEEMTRDVAFFKPPIGLYDDVHLALSDVSSASDFDKLLRKLKSKIVGLYLLGVVSNDLPILVEVRELVSRLVHSDVPTVIFAFVLDLEILLDQAVSVTNLKKSSTNLLEEKYGVLFQQQDTVSRSEQRLAY